MTVIGSRAINLLVIYYFYKFHFMTMAKTTVQPLFSYVLIKPAEAESKTASGIVLVDTGRWCRYAPRRAKGHHGNRGITVQIPILKIQTTILIFYF